MPSADFASFPECQDSSLEVRKRIWFDFLMEMKINVKESFQQKKNLHTLSILGVIQMRVHNLDNFFNAKTPLCVHLLTHPFSNLAKMWFAKSINNQILLISFFQTTQFFSSVIGHPWMTSSRTRVDCVVTKRDGCWWSGGEGTMNLNIRNNTGLTEFPENETTVRFRKGH